MVRDGEIFGYLNDSDSALLFTLKNNLGTEISITNYGAAITSILTKDRNGEKKEIVLGFDTLKGYLKEQPYFGAVIGRYANRISGNYFTLNGKKYRIAVNNGKNHLHGGKKGFDKVLWNYITRNNTLELSYLSPHGEEGYPGNLEVKVGYSLTDKNELIADYRAETDRDTIINLNNHSYFNLDGAGSGTVTDHKLTIYADYYLPVNRETIPLGDKLPVERTPFDFRNGKKIGTDINKPDTQLKYTRGYDHNYIIKGETGKLKPAAFLESDKSGICMEVLTTEPGVQLYTGNFLDGTLSGKEGAFEQYGGVCLETQHFPDSPGFPNFPTTILRKGSVFKSKTVYKFSVKDQFQLKGII